MEPKLPAHFVQRRSERVSIAFPIEVAGIDLAGNRFTERTKTLAVSRYGCSVPLQRALGPQQVLHLRRIGTNETATGYVVSPLVIQTEGRAYGVGTQQPCESLWGIRFASSFYRELLDTMREGVYFVNRERKITYWNAGAAQLAGYTGEEVIGRSCFDNLLGHVDERGRPLCTGGCPLSAAILDGKERRAEFYLHHKEGHRVPVSVHVLPMRNKAGAIIGAVEVFHDSTDSRKAAQKVRELEQLAFRDALTGLANRRFLELKVSQGLEEHRQFARLYGVLMFDLDGFKKINDTHGHDVGDALLKAVAKTIAGGLRPVDLVGRWGGEEFLVLMPDLDAVALGDLAERCRVLIARSSVNHDGREVSVTASIGATVLNHNDGPETALARADALMYESKRLGGDRTTAG